MGGLLNLNSDTLYIMLKWFSEHCPVCIMSATCKRVLVFETALNQVLVMSIYFLFPDSSSFSDILNLFFLL